ncbi:MAG: DMT family transporter [Christensenellales bacterium]
MANKKIIGSLLLLFTAFIWGNGFVAQKIGIVITEPFTFASARFFIGGIALIPYAAAAGRRKLKTAGNETASHEERREKHGLLLTGGFFCGILLAFGTILQQVGMLYTTAGKAGFITALYVVFVPVLGLFLKKKTSPAIWFSVTAAAAGLYLLCVQEGFVINQGDLLVLLCALLFAFHILVIDRFSPKVNGVQLSCVQFFVAAFVSGILMLLFEQPDLNNLLSCWIPLLYLGVVSGAIGFTLQIIGQKYTEPAVASLILSMESVFAAMAGWLFLYERFTVKELLGCFLVFGAVVLSQLSGYKKIRAKKL